MKNDWIIDVLNDLHTFAYENGMKALASQLQDAQLIAAIEIASQNEDATFEPTHADIAIGAHTSGIGEVKRAI